MGAKLEVLSSSFNQNSTEFRYQFQISYTDTTIDLSTDDLEIELWINHYFDPTAISVTTELATGTAGGTATGTMTMGTPVLTHYRTPIIYTITDKIKTKIVLPITGTGVLDASGEYFYNWQISIKAGAGWNTYFKYFGTAVTGQNYQDFDASYSFESGLFYTENDKFVLTHNSSVSYGTRPEDSAIDFKTHAIIEVDLDDYIDEANASTAYPNDLRLHTRWVDGGWKSMRSLLKFTDPSLTIGTMYRAELIVSHDVTSSVEYNSLVELADITSALSATPDWTNDESKLGTTLVTQNMDAVRSQGWDGTQWMFQSATLDTDVKALCNDFSSYYGYGLRYADEANYRSDSSWHAGSDTRKAFIVIAYSASTPPTTSNQRFMVW